MRALHRVLMDQTLRNRMKERGYHQAAKFSWESSVRRILEAYEQVAQHIQRHPVHQPAAD
jgi:glycosyltransferase involved in cell wall biosynthesis